VTQCLDTVCDSVCYTVPGRKIVHRQGFLVLHRDAAIQLCSVVHRELVPQRELEQVHATGDVTNS
jgi:hypothetical protein